MNTVTEKSNVIAIPTAMKDTAGAIVYWRLSGDVDYDQLKEAWEEAGLPAKLLPSLPSRQVALTRAFRDMVKALSHEDRDIHATKLHSVTESGSNHGWILLENVTKKGSEKVRYEEQFRAYFKGDKTLVFKPENYARTEQLLKDFRANQKVLAQTDVGTWMSQKITQDLTMLTLRDTGGIYFVPRNKMERLAQIKQALEKATDNVVFQIPSLKSDEAVEALLDALVREAEAEAQSIEKQLEALDDDSVDDKDKLGARALRSRAAKCDRMTDKVEMFEQILDTRLDALRERMETLQAASVEAAIRLESERSK